MKTIHKQHRKTETQITNIINSWDRKCSNKFINSLLKKSFKQIFLFFRLTYVRQNNGSNNEVLTLRTPLRMLPPATPPFKSSTSQPGLLTSNDRITAADNAQKTQHSTSASFKYSNFEHNASVPSYNHLSIHTLNIYASWAAVVVLWKSNLSLAPKMSAAQTKQSVKDEAVLNVHNTKLQNMWS